MLAQIECLASGSMVPSGRSMVAFRSPTSCPYLGDEQFWGRAVRASCDPLDPGRFLFVGEFPGSPSALHSLTLQVPAKVV
jgi:hypothetical protein